MTSFNLNEKELLSTGIEVKNIVAKLDLNIELDLSYLESELPNSSYEPVDRPSLVFRPDDLSTVLIMRSGVLSFTGGSSIADLRDTHQRMSDELEMIGIDEMSNVDDLELVNVVSTFDMDTDVNLEHLSLQLGLENVEYEPEQFPGLVHRIGNGPVVLVFSSGKAVITGARSTEEILDAAATIRELISY